MEKFSISPSPNLMDVLGNAGYTFESAIEDIVDNSISASAKNISIHIDISKKIEPYTFLYILDDGEGMDLKELKSASIIGDKSISSYRDKDQLGRYSTGLKSASNSLANVLYICSKKEDKNSNTIKIDFEYIREKKDWLAFLDDDFKYSKLIKNKGTLIFCKDLKVLNDCTEDSLYMNKLVELENSLSHVYFKFIKDKRIKITLTTHGNISKPIVIKGWNPFILPNNKNSKLIFNNEVKYKNSCIKIKSYILPTFDKLNEEDQTYFRGKGFLEQQGFYVYRADRLIYEGGWLNLKKLSLNDKARYARIEVDIPNNLDQDFKLNFSKDTVEVPGELIKDFTNIANQARNESNKNYEYMKNPNLKPKLLQRKAEVWSKIHSNEGMILVINQDNPIIQDICKKLTNGEKNRLFKLIAKSLPINSIQHEDIKESKFTNEEYLEQLEAFYDQCKSKGLSIDQIKKEVMKQNIFSNIETSLLVDFFRKKEEQSHD